jgi:hypothetical protein
MKPEQLAEELHGVGLDAYVNFDYMGKSAGLWNRFRLDLATALLEVLDIKYKSNSRFKKPAIQEIKEYCLERNNSINPEQFFDFYECKGWMVGKNKMRDWRAAVRTWERNSGLQKKQSKLENKLNEIDKMYAK